MPAAATTPQKATPSTASADALGHARDDDSGHGGDSARDDDSATDSALAHHDDSGQGVDTVVAVALSRDRDAVVAVVW